MKNEILKLLEEKLKKEFNGTTGTELKEFLAKNSLVLLKKYADAALLIADEFSAPDKYYLSMEAKCAHLLDECFHYEETVSVDEEVYGSVKDMVAAGDDMPMIYGYLESMGKEFGFFQMVELVHNICEEHNARALLEFDNPDGDIDINVEFNGEEIKYNGEILIVDDSGDKLLQSFMWIAYRLGNGDLYKYLSLLSLRIIKEKEVSGLEERLAKTAIYDNNQDIINQISKTPRAIENYINSAKELDEDMIIAFIKSNDKYVRTIVQDVHQSNGFKFFSQTLYVKKSDAFLNGIPSITSELSKILFDQNYLLSHLNVLAELCETLMIRDLCITDEYIDLFIQLFNEYPALIIPITTYYENRFINSKDARESFLKTKKLYENTTNFTLSVLKAIELIEKYNLDGYLYLLDTNFVYFDTAIKRCADLPVDIKRKIISNNYFLMSYYKNDFSFDDPLVIKIVKECPFASLLVNDEAIIRYELQQSRQPICLDCEKKCNYSGDYL